MVFSREIAYIHASDILLMLIAEVTEHQSCVMVVGLIKGDSILSSLIVMCNCPGHNIYGYFRLRQARLGVMVNTFTISQNLMLWRLWLCTKGICEVFWVTCILWTAQQELDVFMCSFSANNANVPVLINPNLSYILSIKWMLKQTWGMDGSGYYIIMEPQCIWHTQPPVQNATKAWCLHACSGTSWVLIGGQLKWGIDPENRKNHMEKSLTTGI